MAKAPAMLRRRGSHKCDLCGRKLLSSAALEIHKHTVHSSAMKALSRVNTSKTKQNTVKKPIKQQSNANNPQKSTKTYSNKNKGISFKKKTILSAQLAKKKKEYNDSLDNQFKKDIAEAMNMDYSPTNTEETRLNKETNISKDASESSVQFGCPLCSKTFLMYFTALKHIQKNHCVNGDGKTVPPDSPDLIKPVHITLCINCGEKVRENSLHDCTNFFQPVWQQDNIVCLGCRNSFLNKNKFKMELFMKNAWEQYIIHLSTMHSSIVESLFFPGYSEFSNWKRDVEDETKTLYVVPNDQRNDGRVVYHCSHKEIYKSDSTVCLCPSAIKTQPYARGIQVHFFNAHYGHDVKPYILKKEFEEYSVTKILSSKKPFNPRNTVHKDFKDIMQDIILKSQKVNEETVKILLQKALEMNSILRDHDTDELNNFATSKVTVLNDSQIEEVLSNNKANSKAKSKDLNSNLEKKVKFSHSEMSSPVARSTVQSPASFVDTYKAFVDNALNAVPKKSCKQNISKSEPKKHVKESTPKCEANKVHKPKAEPKRILSTPISSPSRKDNSKSKKAIMKTKMGQFIPSPKKNNGDVKSPLEKNHSVVKSPIKKNQSVVKSPIKKIQSVVKSPLKKNHSVVKSPVKKDISKIKIEKYEVKERENDCNVLILKF